MFAAATANRTDPILPRLLAGPIAVLAASIAGVVLVTSLFIGAGDFTPMSSGAGTAAAAPMSLWLAAVAATVLWRTMSARAASGIRGSALSS